MTTTALSDSIYESYVPKAADIQAEFVYNFYEKRERTAVTPYKKETPLISKPRYVYLSWSLGSNKMYSSTNNSTTIRDNKDSIISEVDLVSSGYISHVFTDVSHMIQGENDLESSYNMSGNTGNSLAAMAHQVLLDVLDPAGNLTDDQKMQLDDIKKSQAALFSLTGQSLGLTLYGKDGNVITSANDEEILSDISNTLSLPAKISNNIAQDIFRVSPVSTSKNAAKTVNTLKGITPGSLVLSPVSENLVSNIIGYKIDKYLVQNGSYTKLEELYFERPDITTYVDDQVLYGQSYLYAIRVIGAMVVYDDSGKSNTVYVSSLPMTKSVGCFEYKPPPPPTTIDFQFDYEKNRLLITWLNPPNPQNDIKQYQVFRRKSIRHPFELIAQYCFDDSDVGQGGKRFTTGERIDGNDVEKTKMNGLDGLLGVYSAGSVNSHYDEDFIIDTEFFQDEPSFIYALCSIDAHGMISNYSTQTQVSFDQYSNRLVKETIASSGALRQYPNVTLKKNIFKDALRTEDGSTGQTRKMTLCLTPDCIKIKDNLGNTDNVVETVDVKSNSSQPFYMLQLINLDNQKCQQIRIDVNR